MSNRFKTWTTIMPAVLLLAIVTGCRAPGGKTERYSPPRTADGKPDLNGIWQAFVTATWDVRDHNAEFGLPGGQGVVEGNTIPYQTAALAKKRENFERRATADPTTRCYLPGVPRITYMPFPFQITQTAKYVSLTYEYDHATRLVYTDGSPHPNGALAFWMGDSRGHWEGDTLVVDVIDFNDQTWFDHAGDFHSDALHVVERYTRTGPDTIAYDVTIEDPKTFTQPWKMSMPLYRRLEKNVQLLDYECVAFLEEQ